MEALSFEQNVIDRLARIETSIGDLQRTLHGNGHKGLMEDVSDVTNRVTALESSKATIWNFIIGISAFISAVAGWFK